MPKNVKQGQLGVLHAVQAPLAVPDLAVAAQLLGRPLAEVENAARWTVPYPHTDGYPCWSLRQLALALDIIKPRKGAGKQHRVPLPGLQRKAARKAAG